MKKKEIPITIAKVRNLQVSVSSLLSPNMEYHIPVGENTVIEVAPNRLELVSSIPNEGYNTIDLGHLQFMYQLGALYKLLTNKELV
jgi:hypothetical protein